MNLFTHIKQQLSIFEIVSQYTQLKKIGSYFKGCCPFHNEKTASFTISPHKEIFYCFGCQAGGDVIAFMSKMENCTPMEAARHLIEHYQLTVPESLMYEPQQKDNQEKKRYFEICKRVALWSHEMLIKNPSIASGYLAERGINQESIEKFSIGYFPGGQPAIKSLLLFVKGYNLLADDLINAGILMPGKTLLFSSFEERIIFPIKDTLGRFCGFGGRVFRPSDDRAKYYNSKENAFFAKGSLLFGLDGAKQSLQKAESAYIVEGYLDAIAMVQHGYHNTVATLGTACTPTHLATLSRYTEKIMVLYDGDKAGQEATLRLADLCWQVNMELFVVSIPENEDPASLLNSGKDIQVLINGAQDIFLFFINRIGSDFSSQTLQKKLQRTQKLIEVIQKIDDPLKRGFLLQNAAKSLDVPIELLQPHAMRVKKRYEPAAVEKKQRIPEASDDSSKLEKKLFFVIMHNNQLLIKPESQNHREYFSSPIKEILDKLKKAQEGQENLRFNQFFDLLTSQEQLFVSGIVANPEYDTALQEYDQLFMQFCKKNWKSMVNTIKMKLTHIHNDEEKKITEKILQDFLVLKKKLINNNLV